jgi:hypothetical protein
MSRRLTDAGGLITIPQFGGALGECRWDLTCTSLGKGVLGVLIYDILRGFSWPDVLGVPARPRWTCQYSHGRDLGVRAGWGTCWPDGLGGLGRARSLY